LISTHLLDAHSISAGQYLTNGHDPFFLNVTMYRSLSGKYEDKILKLNLYEVNFDGNVLGSLGEVYLAVHTIMASPSMFDFESRLHVLDFNEPTLGRIEISIGYQSIEYEVMIMIIIIY
jgi:hypothetical protein